MDNKQARRLRPGEFEIMIDFCANCKTHNSSLRHDEDKYLGRAVGLRDRLLEEFPFISIVLRPLQNSRANLPRLGCFEVALAAFKSQPKLIFSKLKTFKWPSVSFVVNSVRSELPGSGLSIWLVPPSSLSPSQTPGPFTVRIIPEVELARPSTSRLPSAPLRRRLDSGFESHEEINQMLGEKSMIVEKTVDSSLSLLMPSVRPGKYVARLLGNEDVKETEVAFTIGLAEPEKVIQLAPKSRDDCSLTLSTRNGSSEEVIYVSLKIEKVLGDFELVFSPHRNGFFARNMPVGEAELNVQLARGQALRARLRLFNGRNAVTLDIADRAFDIPPLEAPKEQLRPGNKLQETNRGQETNRIRDSNKAPESIRVPESNRAPDSNRVPETNRTEEDPLFRSEPPEVAEQFEEDFDAGEGEEAEKVGEVGGKDARDGQKSGREFSQLEDSQHRSEKENVNSNEAWMNKQRITSGNRMRPGERLYSAKSASQVVPDDPKSLRAPWSFEPASGLPPAGSASEAAFALSGGNGSLHLISAVENDGEAPQSHLVEEEQLAGLRWLKLRWLHEPMFLRVVVEKSRPGESFEGDLFVCLGKSSSRIDLTLFENTLCSPEENVLDVGFLIGSNQLELIPTLVPMAEIPDPLYGLSEINNLVQFVRNSKFSVSKFFGFDLDEDSREMTISLEDARESLVSYELGKCQFLLDCVRSDRKTSCSLRRLMEIYPKWCGLVEKSELLFELHEVSDEAAEEGFDTDEFVM